MADYPPDLSASLLTVNKLLTDWQLYINQQRSLLAGVATYVTTTPVGGTSQPGPGYYPVTDPAGVTAWQPCLDRIRADAGAFTIEPSPLTNGQTATAAQSGKIIKVSGAGGNTNTVTITFPLNLGAGWNAVYYWEGTQPRTRFAVATGVTLNQDQTLVDMRARYSFVTATAVSNNVIALSGSLIAFVSG